MHKQDDTANWLLPPSNRWSFQHVDQCTRTLRVARANSVSPLAEIHQDILNIAFCETSGEQSTIAEMLTRTYADGFLILHNGNVLAEHYYNGMNASTLHLIMSCSKSITSAVAGIYIDSGMLNPAAMITDYLPELGNSGLAGATVQNALDMQVGTAFDENYEDHDADWAQYEVATGWREDATYNGPRNQINYAAALQSRGVTHGSEFQYQSVLTNVFGCCLERATGKRFDELLAQHIWHPIGAEQDFVAVIDSLGTPSFEGGFNMCLRDFARFGQLIASDGLHEGQQLVPEKWLQACRFPKSAFVTAFIDSDVTGVYHNFWWVRDSQRGVVMALGIHGQMLYIDPQRDFVAAILSSEPQHDSSKSWQSRIHAIEAIIEAVE